LIDKGRNLHALDGAQDVLSQVKDDDHARTAVRQDVEHGQQKPASAGFLLPVKSTGKNSGGALAASSNEISRGVTLKMLAA
jgi:hypothetical protein